MHQSSMPSAHAGLSHICGRELTSGRSGLIQMWPFALGCWGETAGYIVRRFSADHQTGRGLGLQYYIGQELALLLSPALFAATCYMVFGRTIVWTRERYSPIRASRVTATFVTFDILSFVIQGAGGSLYSSDNTNIYSAAKAILLVGFIIQIISVGIFLIFSILYQIRAKRAGEPEGKWSLILYTLYGAVIFILIRGIFRTIEFGSGGNNSGYLLEHEAFCACFLLSPSSCGALATDSSFASLAAVYGLEALPMFLCTVLVLVINPGRFVPTDRSVRLHPEDVVVVDEKGSTDSLAKTGRTWYGKKRAAY